MSRLLLLFIVVPAIELILLIQIGLRIGPVPTILLIVITGVLGASLARYQGLAVLAKVREELAGGRLPTGSILDGVIILVAGAVLMTPGILTDIFGFLCLIPGTRQIIKGMLQRWFRRAIQSGRIHVSAQFDARGFGTPPQSTPGSRPTVSRPIVDVKPEAVTDVEEGKS